MSANLSAAMVCGGAALLLLPQHPASAPGTHDPQAVATPIKVIRSASIPVAGLPRANPLVQYAARRARERGDHAPKKKEPNRHDSGISKAPASEPPQKPVENAAIPAEAKPAEAQAEPPKPDVWSDAEVIAALRACLQVLGPIAAEVEAAQPVKHEKCGAAAPVLLRRVGSEPNKIEINPPAMLNCAMVAHLHEWVEETLQPAAQEALGTPIKRLRNASGYSCRNRNGSKYEGDRLSEHALANAIDIAGFTTADGRTIDVAKYWGPTLRDEREAAKLAAAQAKEAKKPPAKGEEKEAVASRRDSGISADPDHHPKGNEKQEARKTAELRKLGRGVSDASSGPQTIPAPVKAEREAAMASPEGSFLRRLHKGACGLFHTVLGPEANEAHRDHFHLDLADRKRRAFCE